MNGLPSLFKFMPSIAEIREAMDKWEEAERVRQERLERYGGPLSQLPQLPPPRSEPWAATRSGLMREYQLNGIPQGWGAVDVVRAAHEHGAMLPQVVDELLARGGPAPLPAMARTIKRAMDERIAGQEPAKTPARELVDELEP